MDWAIDLSESIVRVGLVRVGFFIAHKNIFKIFKFKISDYEKRKIKKTESEPKTVTVSKLEALWRSCRQLVARIDIMGATSSSSSDLNSLSDDDGEYKYFIKILFLLFSSQVFNRMW